jgi:hypothetical protein
MTDGTAAGSAPQCGDTISFDGTWFACDLNRGHDTDEPHTSDTEADDGRRTAIAWQHTPVVVPGEVIDRPAPPPRNRPLLPDPVIPTT